MKKPKAPTISVPNPAVQANAQQTRSSALQAYLPPALLTPIAPMRRATTQKRELIGGGGSA